MNKIHITILSFRVMPVVDDPLTAAVEIFAAELRFQVGIGSGFRIEIWYKYGFIQSRFRFGFGDYFGFGFAQFSFGSDLGSFSVRHSSVTVHSVQVRFDKKNRAVT
uniref:Uncharacterized protein n=1 Tax=Helianthus annuus TaxID=4232 RepID=A0A251VD69_HELAN